MIPDLVEQRRRGRRIGAMAQHRGQCLGGQREQSDLCHGRCIFGEQGLKDDVGRRQVAGLELDRACLVNRDQAVLCQPGEQVVEQRQTCLGDLAFTHQPVRI